MEHNSNHPADKYAEHYFTRDTPCGHRVCVECGYHDGPCK